MSGIAERLIALRGSRSRRSFAEEIETRESTLRNYEQGLTQPTADFLENICLKLRISPQWLLLGEGDRPAQAESPPGSRAELDALKMRIAELELEKNRLELQNSALAEENRLVREMRLSRDKDVEHYQKVVDGLMAHLQAFAQKGEPSGHAFALPGALPDATTKD